MKPDSFLKSLLIASFILGINNPWLNAQETKWSLHIDSANIFSSPRFADLNGDGTKDIVIGAGIENVPVSNGIVAVNGKNGELLWTVPARTQIYTSALFQDITGDSISDVFIGGRAASFYAIDGASGKVIWEFFEGTDNESRKAGLLNFFATQWIDDQNNDGYDDLLVTNGGDYLASPNKKDRPSAVLMIISGVDGSVIHKSVVPEDRESYYAPHTYTANKPMIVFGTGGETIDGTLWEVSLKHFLKDKLDKAKVITKDSVKGFILNSIIADLNGDGFPDIANARMNSTLSAINGKTHSLLWEHSFDGYECYVTPSFGQFVGDNTPDMFTILAKGSFPAYESFKLIIINGRTGEIAWQEDSGFNQFSPAVSADMDNDGTDEIIYIENKLTNPETFSMTNQLRVINIVSGKSYYLGNARNGLSMAAAPGIIDLDGDGTHEIVVASSSIPMGEQGQFSMLECISLEKMLTQLTWPGYLGPLENGILKNY